MTSNEFDLAPSEKRSTYEFLSDSGFFFYRVIVLTSQVATFVPGQRSRSHRAKRRRKHFLRKIGQAISNLVAVLVSDVWAMAGKNGTVFDNWPPS